MAAHPVTLLDAYPALAAPANRMCDEHCANLPQASAPPGGLCYRCYSSLRTLDDGRVEQVLDLGVWIEMEGKLILCETCGSEIADVLGFLPPDKAEKLRQTNRNLGMENATLRKKVAAAMNAVDQLSATIQRPR